MARTKSGEKQKRKEHQESNSGKTETEFEIEKILDKRGAARTLQYFVKWKGYPDSDNTWENSKDLPSNLVKKFETSLKKAEIVHRSAESDSEPEQEDDDGDDDYSGRVKTPKKTPKKSKAATPKRGKGGKVEKRGRAATKKSEPVTPKKTPAKKSKSPAKKPAKKETPKKKTPVKKVEPPKPKVWVITDRKIIDNVVHYGVKNRVKPVPIYDFEDFQPIFEFEMEQAQKDEALMTPIRIVEKKGNKYLVEWKGSASNTWETKANLACAKLMSDFDDREEDEMDDDDVEYSIKKIIGKRKNGRTYEFQVVWSGCSEDTATWEPEDNLQNAKSMISNFERAQKKEFEAEKAKKRKARAKSASPKKSRK